MLREEHVDLVVGDEAWEVDHFLHENPELKRGAYAWLTDFVGWLPMPDGGEREAVPDRRPTTPRCSSTGPASARVRDRSIFVGNAGRRRARRVRAGAALDP